MKNFSRILSIVALTAVPLVAPAQSTAEMNRMLGGELERADGQLNKVYKRALAKLDEEGQSKLKAAQRAWIAFRDAEALLHGDTVARGGTLASQIILSWKTNLTKERTKHLESLLEEAGE